MRKRGSGAPRARKPRGSYHHGDLRRALLDEARRVIAAEGVEALGLRDLARHLGVSHAAPAHHFPDRAALLVALAGEGFARLGAALEAAGAGAPGRARLSAAGRAFIAFALDDPGAFRAMFGRHVGGLPGAPPDVGRVAAGGYRVLTGAFEEMTGDGGERSAHLAFAAWSLLHGAATLFLDGLLTLQLPELASRAVFEEWVARGLAALCDGAERAR